jgi:uncharacterized FAD-dependent dehydrogenase
MAVNGYINAKLLDSAALNIVENTLKDVTPGGYSMALPHRIVMDIIEVWRSLTRSCLRSIPIPRFYMT